MKQNLISIVKNFTYRFVEEINENGLYEISLYLNNSTDIITTKIYINNYKNIDIDIYIKNYMDDVFALSILF